MITKYSKKSTTTSPNLAPAKAQANAAKCPPQHQHNSHPQTSKLERGTAIPQQDAPQHHQTATPRVEPRCCSTCIAILPKLAPANGQAKNSAKAPQHHQKLVPAKKINRGIATHQQQVHRNTTKQRTRELKRGCHDTAASAPQHHHTATLPASSSAEPQCCSRCTKTISPNRVPAEAAAGARDRDTGLDGNLSRSSALLPP